MEQRYRAFLQVAETLNMSRAAEICFVSPQCISGHIRSLESEYGVQLFQRHPKLVLTPEGMELKNTLQKMLELEKGISGSLRKAIHPVEGKMTIGLPISRYTELVPKLVIPFKEKYPGVRLNILDERSSEVEWRVSDGILDLAIASRQIASPDLERIHLLDDRYMLLVSNRVLRQYYGSDIRELCRRLKKGISIEEMAGLPLILNSVEVSRMRRALDHYAMEKGLRFRVVFESSRFDMVDSLVRKAPLAGLVPHMMLETTMRANAYSNDEEAVQMFPLQMEPLQFKSSLYLVMHKKAEHSPFREELIRIIREQFAVYAKAQAEQLGE